MTISQIKEKLKSSEYDFLRNHERLGSNIFLLTLGGSHAYGTDHEGSDLDVRGMMFNSKEEILLGNDIEQVVDVPTDTTVYTFNKMIKLLTSCNPNTIEILGCKPEHYLYVNDIGKQLLDNADMFVSQLCIHTFAGYANSQLRRLENKAARFLSQPQQEANILKSIENGSYSFKHRYHEMSDYAIRLYIDDAVERDVTPSLEKEIFMDVNLSHYPLRDYANIHSEMRQIIASYDKFGKRNQNAVTHDKLCKHMTHLIRLFLTCLDLLENGKIVTYRENDLPLLRSILNGDYLGEDKQPTPEFFQLVNDFEKKMDYAKQNTSIQAKPDKKRIEEFRMHVNEYIVKHL